MLQAKVRALFVAFPLGPETAWRVRSGHAGAGAGLQGSIKTRKKPAKPTKTSILRRFFAAKNRRSALRRKVPEFQLRSVLDLDSMLPKVQTALVRNGAYVSAVPP